MGPSGHGAAVRARGGAAFTLIELLVVIAIIAILVSILLPALAGGREASRQVICSSNVRQLLIGFTNYAQDYKVIPGAYWQGPLDLDWCGRNNVTYASNPSAYRHPFETSCLKEYLDKFDRIMECPAAKRESNRFFDYTMIIRMPGARVDLAWRVNYPLRPQNAASARKDFPGIPLLIEEHDEFYNRSFDDGSFAGTDQWSTRHVSRGSGSAVGGAGGGSHTGYLDASVGLFRPPVGGNDRVAEAADLNASQLRMIKIPPTSYTLNSSTAAEFGWVNRSR